ncbi:MAG: hypothetical protein QME77_12745 [bacterium]|nr:hypothetical protein [bacterium]
MAAFKIPTGLNPYTGAIQYSKDDGTSLHPGITSPLALRCAVHNVVEHLGDLYIAGTSPLAEAGALDELSRILLAASMPTCTDYRVRVEEVSGRFAARVFQAPWGQIPLALHDAYIEAWGGFAPLMTTISALADGHYPQIVMGTPSRIAAFVHGIPPGQDAIVSTDGSPGIRANRSRLPHGGRGVYQWCEKHNRREHRFTLRENQSRAKVRFNLGCVLMARTCSSCDEYRVREHRLQALERERRLQTRQFSGHGGSSNARLILWYDSCLWARALVAVLQPTTEIVTNSLVALTINTS